MSRAISRNLVAQSYAQAVSFAVQLGMVPVLIALWGVETFGVWALVTALPAYLAFSDFGFTFIAKNDMAMRVSGDDRAGALVTFQSIFVILLAVAASLGGVLVALVYALPLEGIFNLGPVSKSDLQAALTLQIGAALGYQFTLLLSAGVRCEGRAALETGFAATGRLVEAGAILVAALLGGGLVAAAAAALVARVAVVFFLVAWLRRTTPWLTLGTRRASRARIKALLGPSLDYMAIPLSNALLIQAPVVILGVTATPAMVAVYSVTRTVTRLGMSVGNMVSYAFTPEYSFAFGRRDRASFDRLLRTQARTIAALALIYAALAAWIVPWGVAFLSSGALQPVTSLSLSLAGAVVFEILWTNIFSPFSAINAHRRIVRAFVIVTAFAIASAAGLGGPTQIALCVLGAHLAMLVVTAQQVPRLRDAIATLAPSKATAPPPRKPQTAP
ncbi:lipopolysaccharide biosynthesis protein [Celeribacter sp.]|uniref:lipopolysaccharide biosynthesis protein n=1 Tax=Celeribacter sp. TaxID=1890673 RepID=UPI003A8DB880